MAVVSAEAGAIRGLIQAAELLPDTEYTEKLLLKRTVDARLRKEKSEQARRETEQDEAQRRIKDQQDSYVLSEAARAEMEHEEREAHELLARKKAEESVQRILQSIPHGINVPEVCLDVEEVNSVEFGILCDMLKMNACVRALHFERLKLQDHDGVVVSHLIGASKSIERVFLDDNALSCSTLEALSVVVEKNCWLKVLSLRGNDLSSAGPAAFLQFMQSVARNRSLRSLDVSNCWLTAECGLAITSCLRENTTLVQVDVSRNGFSDSLWMTIVELCNSNRRQYDVSLLRETEERRSLAEGDEESRLYTDHALRRAQHESTLREEETAMTEIHYQYYKSVHVDRIRAQDATGNELLEKALARLVIPVPPPVTKNIKP